MSAATRWVQYDVTSAGTAGTGGTTRYGRGTRAYSIATASVGDSFNIGTANNRLYVSIDGVTGPYITLASGSALDPRFVAKDITEALHNKGKAEAGWDQAQCIWEDNRFILYSGSLGSSTVVTISSGTNTAHLELGWGTNSEQGGLDDANGNTNNYITVSGTYNGFFDEIYRIVINNSLNIGTPTKGGSNTFTGTITPGNVFNDGETVTYVLSIDTTNGTTMGAGTGNVPTLSWTGDGSGSGAAYDDGGPTELLYANHWYNVGVFGLMVKFSDAIFNTVATGWTIICSACLSAEGGNEYSPHGTAEFIWGSSRGDDSLVKGTTNTSVFQQLGSRGLTVKWDETANASAGDEYYVICTPPQPSSYDISNLNYGNVTVSTESSVKAVMFEIMSGAVEISTVKFGLQANGNFSHHNSGNSDTKFRFGTVGAGNNAGINPEDGYEWRATVTSADIDNDVPPSYLYATKENLAVVSDADSSEDIGVSTFAGMVADPVWLNIKLGQSEVGANSTINYRIYFDYA
jgi:hypothetical protein